MATLDQDDLDAIAALLVANNSAVAAKIAIIEQALSDFANNLNPPVK